MENQQQKDWPKKSDFCKKHTFAYAGWLLQVLAISVFFCAYLFHPTWYMALIGACMLFAFFVFILVQLYDDHVCIMRLRRMYEDYFDYCIAQKRFIYQMEQKMKEK